MRRLSVLLPRKSCGPTISVSVRAAGRQLAPSSTGLLVLATMVAVFFAAGAPMGVAIFGDANQQSSRDELHPGLTAKQLVAKQPAPAYLSKMARDYLKGNS